jgi:hypothetical protein
VGEGRIAKLIVEWIPGARGKRGRARNAWMEGVQAAMISRNLEKIKVETDRNGVGDPEASGSC